MFVLILTLFACNSLPSQEDLEAMTDEERSTVFIAEAVEISGVAAQSPVQTLDILIEDYESKRALILATTEDGRTWCVESTTRHTWFDACTEETAHRRADILNGLR